MWVDRPESPLTYNQMFRRRMEPAVLTTKLVNSADPGTQYQSLSCKLSGSHLGFGSSLRTHRQQLDNTDCILQPCSRESALLRALFFVSVTPHSTWPQQSRMVLRTGIQTEGKFHGTLRFHLTTITLYFRSYKDNWWVFSIAGANKIKITYGILSFPAIDLFRLPTMKA